MKTPKFELQRHIIDGKVQIELVAFLSNLNYALDLESKNLADAKTEAARYITNATAKVTIYENRDDSEALIPLSYVNVYDGEELDWNDM